jgi:hypothetical protein
MYALPSWLIASLLLAAMIGAMKVGLAAGRRAKPAEAVKDHTNSVQTSLLGLLALLLGFTFSLSLNRFDDRSEAVVAEANALGTAYLRTDLLQSERGQEAKRLLHSYGMIRIQAGGISASDHAARDERREEAEALGSRLWRLAAAENLENPGPAAVSFATALNEAFDAFSARDAAIDRHVPELVLFLLFGTFLLLGAVIGYSSTISGVRPGVPVYSLMILIVVLVFLIVDLDRPRRGLISVDQTPLRQAVAAMPVNSIEQLPTDGRSPPSQGQRR